MKSRATWLESGDQNTKFFQNYANHRKNINTIWEMPEMPNPNGVKVRGFKALAELGTTHFKNLLSEHAGANIGETLKVI